MYAEINEPGRALREVEAIGALRPGDPECAKMRARLMHRLAQPLKAIEV